MSKSKKPGDDSNNLSADNPQFKKAFEQFVEGQEEITPPVPVGKEFNLPNDMKFKVPMRKVRIPKK
jgi:hypothetical protein